MSKEKYNSVSLLIDESKNEWYAIAPLFFEIGMFSKRQIKNKNIGVLIISRDGCAQRIKSVDVHGFYGKKFMDWLTSALSGSYSITVYFDPPMDMSLEDFKELVIRYLESERTSSDPNLPQEKPLDEVIALVRSSSSYSEVFNHIGANDPENCLDIY